MGITYKMNGRAMSADEFAKAGRRDGIREILESGEFPGLQTDDEFMAGRGTLRDQLKDQTDEIVSAARRQGYEPSRNDVYLPSLAERPGDPQAFVRHDSARGEIRRRCERRGWACDGSVKVRGREAEPKKKALGDDIVSDAVRQLKMQDRKARKAPKKDLIQEVIRKHGDVK